MKRGTPLTRLTREPAFISSVRVESGRGGHEYVTVFIRHACVGTLTVGEGDGLRLQELLSRGLSGAEGALWCAREILIDAARDVVLERGGGAVDMHAFRVLALAVQKYDEAEEEVTQ